MLAANRLTGCFRVIQRSYRYFSRLEKIRIDTRLSSIVPMETPHQDMEILQSDKATSLKLKMIEEIKEKGPMSIARFMHLCLADPQYGYYTTKDVIFNKGGDFTTSPEISQMFGEIVAIWYVAAMQKYTNLKHCNFVEFGPGKATLMCDMLRSFSQLNVLSNMTFNLIEISENLQEVQRDNIIKTLKNRGIYVSIDMETQNLYEDSLNIHFKWSENIDKIKEEEAKKLKEISDNAKASFLSLRRAIKNENPYFIMAHEFFDAIPVYQFIYDEYRGWLERVVDIDKNKKNQLDIVESEKPTPNVKKLLQPEKTFNTQEMRDSLKTGDMIEISPQSQNIMTDIAELISITKGAGLIIDYGEDQALTHSVRAIKKHKYLSEQEMLRQPGKADVSAYVNFRALRDISERVPGCIAKEPMPQGAFLESLGMGLRLQALAKGSQGRPNSKKIIKSLEDEYLRLVHPDQMGEIYKVLFIGNKHIGEIFPFNTSESVKDEYE
ncbi:unnamed protein product [Moneuplotes crassus]|uniref:Protein arginine methyltransferase NDUFAF7 n=1 Tax=Euplotes crassus TaxID=5936 RepID=A0AAD1UF62_EUPCR|nr:unnamed protein product [Moneuplotes crassus]